MPKKKPTKTIAIFGNSLTTKICIKEFCRLGYKVVLFFPERKLALYKYYRFKDLGVEVEFFSDIESESLLKKLSELNPDYIFSIVFAYKIPKKIIDQARVMALNFHASLLPQYRSQNPYFWVIRNGEKISGITVHRLTDGWESGPIIYQKKFSLHEYDTFGTYIKRIEFYAKYIIEDINQLLISEKLKEHSQGSSPYFPRKKYKDIVIDWTQPAKSIEFLVRACNPKPGALTYFRNMILRILEVNLSPFSAGKPGEISIIDNDLFISAHDHKLKISIIESAKEGFFSGMRFASFCRVGSGEMFQNLADFLKEEDLNRII
ncbi:methionyl-tRNA formyltransferase [Candidatus Margulisiibacteriota bacterium]